MLKQRILTAIILVPLVLWALFSLPDTYLITLVSVVLLIGAFEWLRLAGITSPVSKVFFVGLQMLLFYAVWQLTTAYTQYIYIILISAVLGWIMIFFWLFMYEKAKITFQLNQVTRVVLGLLVLPLCLLGISYIVYHVQHDRLLILFMFLLIWGADIAAYFSGKAFGKNKLAPTISPGKSWEGVYGALIATVLIAACFKFYMGYDNKNLLGLILFSLLVVIISIVGDLFESLLKRQAGIKDSSNILPGHGGILDRIDSMIAASPVFALGVYSLGIS